MMSVLSTTIAPEPEVDAVLEPPPDLGELAESATSLGSFCLRWQLMEPVAPGTAVL